MKKLAVLFATLLAASSLSAVCTCAAPGTDWPSPLNFDVGVGYREDDVRWNIANFGNVPNILSELKWKKLQMFEVGAEASYVSCRNYAVSLKGDYGYILSGKNTDADFAGNDRTGMFSLSENNAGKGYVYDFSGAVGYRVTSNCGRFIGTPMIGYSISSQHLHQFDGQQISYAGYIIDEPIQGPTGEPLNSYYTTRWYGPWIGVEFSARVESCAYVFGAFEWHLVSYRGAGQHNLRTDIGPFHDHAHGTGYIITLGGNWEIWNHWSIGVVSNFRYYKTNHGTQTTEFIVQTYDTIDRFEASTRFNQAKWKSIDALAIVAWRF